MPLADHSHHLLRRAVVAAGAITVFGVVLVGRTEMASADFARAACADLSGLLEVDSPTQAEVNEAVALAAARADRAATVDASFSALDTDFDRIHDAVRQANELTDGEAEVADAAIASVARRCSELAAPSAGDGSRLGTLTIEDLRRP
jgi:hypothetical protein